MVVITISACNLQRGMGYCCHSGAIPRAISTVNSTSLGFFKLPYRSRSTRSKLGAFHVLSCSQYENEKAPLFQRQPLPSTVHKVAREGPKQPDTVPTPQRAQHRKCESELDVTYEFGEQIEFQPFKKTRPGILEQQLPSSLNLHRPQCVPIPLAATGERTERCALGGDLLGEPLSTCGATQFLFLMGC